MLLVIGKKLLNGMVTNLLLSAEKKVKFWKQFSLLDNRTTLHWYSSLLTDKKVSNIHFPLDDIRKIISKLNSNKVHGQDIIKKL